MKLKYLVAQVVGVQLGMWALKGAVIVALIAGGVKLASAQVASELIIATGNLKSGTYSQMFSELNRFCQPSTIGIMIKQRETTGSVENMNLLLTNKVNGAIMQSDLLFLARSQDKTKTEPIKTLFGMHPEELHFIARSDVQKTGKLCVKGYGSCDTIEYKTLGSLKGRTIGAVGGSVMSANVVSQFAGLDLNVQEFANNDALKAALLENKVDAILVVGGAPHALVASLDTRFRLLPVGQDTQAVLKDIYAPALLSYDNLRQGGVPTLTTQALFVTRTYNSAKMIDTLSKLRKCAKDSIPELKDALGTHAKWQQVEVGADGKWPLYDLPAQK